MKMKIYKLNPILVERCYLCPAVKMTSNWDDVKIQRTWICKKVNRIICTAILLMSDRKYIEKPVIHEKGWFPEWCPLEEQTWRWMKMKIYEWTYWSKRNEVGYTIQIVEDDVEKARQKAIEHLEATSFNKYLLEIVKTNKPTVFEKGIQTIEDVAYEGCEIKTY